MFQRLPDMNKKKKTDDSRKKQFEEAQKTADSTRTIYKSANPK